MRSHIIKNLTLYCNLESKMMTDWGFKDTLTFSPWRFMSLPSLPSKYFHLCLYLFFSSFGSETCMHEWPQTTHSHIWGKMLGLVALHKYASPPVLWVLWSINHNIHWVRAVHRTVFLIPHGESSCLIGGYSQFRHSCSFF